MSATARHAHDVAAPHTRRKAMSPNANGSTRSATHTGTPAAISAPSTRSSVTRLNPPTANTVDTAAPTVAATSLAACAVLLCARNSPVASDSNFPSRAAIAAPSIPTHIVKCCANGAAPGMPVENHLRRTISPSGITMIPAMASSAIVFSTRTIAPGVDEGEASAAALTSAFCGRRCAPGGRRQRRRRAPSCRASM